MTANQIVAVLVPVFIVVFTLLCRRWIAQTRQDPPPQTHAPHAPSSGNDPAKIAQSKMEGLGSQSNSSHF